MCGGKKTETICIHLCVWGKYLEKYLDYSIFIFFFYTLHMNVFTND